MAAAARACLTCFEAGFTIQFYSPIYRFQNPACRLHAQSHEIINQGFKKSLRLNEYHKS